MEKEGRTLSDLEARVVVERNQGLKTFDLVDVHIEPWSSEPLGYSGKHLRVKIAVKLHTGEDSVQQFFAKCIPYSKDLKPRELLDYLQLFRSEFLFFSEILPAFSVQTDPFTPRCFYSTEDLLVMEDLSREGYSSPAVRDLMSYDDCVATLRSLAQLHAASLAFEEHHPERKTVLESWTDAFPTETESVDYFDDWLVTGIKTLEFLVDIVPEVDDREALKRLLKLKREDIMKAHNVLRKASSRHRNVLSHGDMWSSNILIKRSADGHQVDVKLIDFQILCYAPAAYDVTFFLYQVSDRQFRKQHQDSLLASYYKDLAESLKKYQIDVENILTFNDFLDSCAALRPFAIIIAALYLPHTMMETPYLKEILSSKEILFEFMNVDRTEFIMRSFENDALYRLRICDIFSEYIDWVSDTYK